MRLRLIGVGVGDPASVTLAARDALRSVDVFFYLDKPGAAGDLTRVRKELLSEHVPGGGYAEVVVPDPPRDRTAADYPAAVHAWRAARVDALADAVRRHVPPGGTAGLLVWGDPSLYDGSLVLAQGLAALGDLDGGAGCEYDVIPGVSSVHALTAAHRIPLNRVAGSVLVTTGRQLEQRWPDGVDDVVVMLDSHLVARIYPQAYMYWGAYLGAEHQLLARGVVADVIDEIADMRSAARAEHGWLMDTYLLRRNASSVGC